MRHSSLGITAMPALLVAISCAAIDGAGDARPPRSAEATELGTCEGFGPQAPRDIDDPRGENRQLFSFAPAYDRLNLCNIHMHRSAEHKAKDFAIEVEASDGGHGGYQCAISETLTPAELTSPASEICSGLRPGDTIEVHWVYSSCDVGPGEGLGACLEATCVNPDLRVEAQVFVLVNDRSALDFNDFGDTESSLYHQAASLPTGTGAPVTYLGSTTGPGYSDDRCSPFQVSWSVRPRCAKLDINSLGTWCRSNPFAEHHAHGVRELVKDRALLAPIE